MEKKLQELNDNIKDYENKLLEKEEEINQYQVQVQKYEELVQNDKGDDGLREKYESMKNMLKEKEQEIDLLKQQGAMDPKDTTEMDELRMKYNRLKEEIKQKNDNENDEKGKINPNDNNDVIALKKEFQKVLGKYKDIIKKKNSELLLLKGKENIDDEYSDKLKNLEKMLANVNNQLDIARENNKRLLKIIVLIEKIIKNY